MDWTGESCVIVASGPSARSVPLEKAKGKAKFIAVNRSWELCPWTDVLYGCDWAWWNSEKGVPAFSGLKICGDPRAHRENWGCSTVKVLIGVDTLVLEPGCVGRGGGSGGFQAVNLAVQWGVKKIILVGFDATLENGTHWHGDHGKGLGNPHRNIVSSWRRAMDAAATVFKSKGITVLNVSESSALTAYPKLDLETALNT
jgi:hypothetical protein